MSKVEIIILIVALAIPFVSILFVLPKRKKKDKEASKTKPYIKEEVVEPPKPMEQPTLTAKVEEKPKMVKPLFEDDDTDFKAYLDLKRKRLSAPERKEFPSGVRGPLGEYIPARLRNQQQATKNKTVAEQIQELSPELKALILSGVLDRKDY